MNMHLITIFNVLVFASLFTSILLTQQNYNNEIRQLLKKGDNISENNLDNENTPSTSRINPLFWFKVDSLKGYKNGDKIKTWKDQSVNRHDAITFGENSLPVFRYEPILNENARPYLEFDGKSRRFVIYNHSDINIKYFYLEKTIIAVFKTSYDIESQQVIYEEGGPVRGLNISIHKGRMFIGGYNFAYDDNDTTPWGYVHLSMPIELNQFYIAVLAFNFNKKAFEGYLNGKYLGKIDKIGILYRHPDGVGIGAVNSDTILYNNIFRFGYGGGHHFNGGIYEILYYDNAFNTSQSSVVQAYLAAKYDIELYED